MKNIRKENDRGANDNIWRGEARKKNVWTERLKLSCERKIHGYQKFGVDVQIVVKRQKLGIKSRQTNQTLSSSTQYSYVT